MRATLLKIVWPAGLPTDTLDAGFLRKRAQEWMLP